MDDITLQAAKDQLRNQIANGTGAKCPCCTQTVKIYRRNINSGMALMLVRAYRDYGRDWFHLPTAVGLRTYSGEGSQFRFWGLLEQDPDRQGYWRITEAGEDFVRERSAVPKYALIFNARCLRHEGENVTIQDCLGDKFDYDELMGQRFDNVELDHFA